MEPEDRQARLSVKNNGASRAARFGLFQGILPIDRRTVPIDIAAGVTLAALAIPEVMGYTSIARMPVVTGLYTILIPLIIFAILGSSRHLVIGADSATAAILAAGLAGTAATAGSDEWVALAAMVALMTGVWLIVARFARLGFIADFLSSTVLIGFLTGVGIQVAAGQLTTMLGIDGAGIGPLQNVLADLSGLPSINMATILISVAVLATVIGGRLISKKIPGALVAVLGSIAAGFFLDLASHGVHLLGAVEGGLPPIGMPRVNPGDIPALIPISLSVFVVILTQSAATSGAYAAKHRERFSMDADLVGLGVANFGAGLSGTFMVSGSPTKTQMVDGAGGMTQIAQLTTSLIVVIVLLFLTGPLQYMPVAALAAVVFVIGIEVIDLVDTADPALNWLCIEMTSVTDVDYTAATTLTRIIEELKQRGVKLVFSHVGGDVIHDLDASGITSLVGEDSYFPTTRSLLQAYAGQHGIDSDGKAG